MKTFTNDKGILLHIIDDMLDDTGKPLVDLSILEKSADGNIYCCSPRTGLVPDGYEQYGYAWEILTTATGDSAPTDETIEVLEHLFYSKAMASVEFTEDIHMMMMFVTGYPLDSKEFWTTSHYYTQSVDENTGKMAVWKSRKYLQQSKYLIEADTESETVIFYSYDDNGITERTWKNNAIVPFRLNRMSHISTMDIEDCRSSLYKYEVFTGDKNVIPAELGLDDPVDITVAYESGESNVDDSMLNDIYNTWVEGDQFKMTITSRDSHNIQTLYVDFIINGDLYPVMNDYTGNITPSRIVDYLRDGEGERHDLCVIHILQIG